MKLLRLIYNKIFKKVISLIFIPCALFFSFSKPIYAKESKNRFNFDYWKGSYEQIISQVKEIQIMQWNVCMAGFASKDAGGVDNSEERVDKIIDMIDQENSDIVILQEVYEHSAAKKIFESLRHKYSHIYTEIGAEASSFLGKAIAKVNPFYKSGLMVLSRYEIENPDFISFSDIEGSQKAVNKGVFIWDFFINNKKIAIAATHLNPSDDDNAPTQEEQKIRKEEIERIRLLLEDRKAHYAYMFGDMNIDKDKEEFSHFAKNGFNLLSVQGKDLPTNAAQALKTGQDKKEFYVKIDYPLEWKKNLFSPFSYYRILMHGFNSAQVLSDHQPTLTKIVFQRKGVFRSILSNIYVPLYNAFQPIRLSKCAVK